MKVRLPSLVLTSKQTAAMNAEIRKQILEMDEKFSIDCDATVLWTMHVRYGFGKKRLRNFWEAYFQEHQRLRERYELPPEDDGWLYREKLKQIGVDLEEWYNEKNKGG